MVELCIAQRIAWTSMATLVAAVAIIPRLQEFTTHGKLLEQAPRRSRLGSWFGATVPKRWFLHFYLLGLVTTSLIILDMSILGGDLLIEPLQSRSVCSMIGERSPDALELGAEGLACLVLLFFHLCRRLWECSAITRWGSARMHWQGYLVGLVHYQLLVVTIVVEAPRLTSFANGVPSCVGAWEVGHRLLEKVEFRHVLGLGLFIVATARQHEAIRHLASLRGGTASAGGDGKGTGRGPAVDKVINVYSLPTEGWFQYVSCPHYLAEVMIYVSFWLVAGARGGALGQGYQLALTWVFSNHAFVAARTHLWYQKKFEDYPPRRRRLIPGIW